MNPITPDERKQPLHIRIVWATGAVGPSACGSNPLEAVPEHEEGADDAGPSSGRMGFRQIMQVPHLVRAASDGRYIAPMMCLMIGPPGAGKTMRRSGCPRSCVHAGSCRAASLGYENLGEDECPAVPTTRGNSE